MREQGKEQPWYPYLLPAGTSDRLSARISQLVDMDWGECIQHLQNAMESKVPSKVFMDMNILCLSPDFVPLQTKSKKVCV